MPAWRTASCTQAHTARQMSLLDCSTSWACLVPQRNVRFGGTEQRAELIEHGGARTARADVDAEEMLFGHAQ